jgi:hypothetical protein
LTPDGNEFALIRAAVSYRVAPDQRTTFPAKPRSLATTASETAPVPPRTTMTDGFKRASSAAVGAGRDPRSVRSTGPFARAAAGAPASASGNDAPVATNTVDAVLNRDLLMAAAVAYRSAPAMRLISVSPPELGGVGLDVLLQTLTNTMTEYMRFEALDRAWLPPAWV